MAFKDVLFPPEINYGIRGGPQFFTTVNTTKAGFERRNVNWEQIRHKFNLEHALKTSAQIQSLLAFHMVVEGKAHSFRFKNHTDFEVIGFATGESRRVGDEGKTGDSSETDFQMLKNHLFTTIDGGGTFIYDQVIILPRETGTEDVNATVVYLDGVVQSSGFTIDFSTGIISFSVAPGTGVKVQWSGEFDLMCRFVQDLFDSELEFFNTFNVDVEVIEVRAEEELSP